MINSGYDMIRYDSLYLTCSKKLTGSQLSPPYGNMCAKNLIKRALLVQPIIKNVVKCFLEHCGHRSVQFSSVRYTRKTKCSQRL